MNKLFKNPSANISKGYSPFDLSHSIHFSSTTGELLPVLTNVLLPGDKITLKSTLRSRTKELTSNAMVGIHQKIDYFFVPYKQLLSSFDSIVYSINDLSSDFFFRSHQSYEPLITTKFPLFNFYPILSFLKTYFDGDFKPDTTGADTYTLYDNFGFPRAFSMYRLLSMLGYGIDSFLSSESFSDEITPYLNIFKLLAYQKIYSDYFRDTDREENNPCSYNIDSYSSSSHNLIDTPSLREDPNFYEIFQLRYRRWNADPNTNVSTSPIFSVSDPNVLDEHFYTKLQSILNDYPIHEQYDRNIGSSSPVGVTSSNNTVNTNTIRNIFAAEKYGEITRRISKHYDSLTKSRFGVNVPNGVGGECFYLKSDSSDINILDVVSTSATSDAPLGEIAGKGFGYNHVDEPLEFEAPCHGILMGIYSCYPDSYYTSNYIDKTNFYENSIDFYTPELDNLGMTPRYYYEYSSSDVPAERNFILGWQYNYSELKQHANYNYGAFMGSLNYWSTQRFFPITYFGDSYGRNPYRVRTAKDIPSNPYAFKVSPYELDNIMLVSYKWFQLRQFYRGGDVDEVDTINDSYNLDMLPKNVFDRDPLFHQLSFEFKKLSKMSIYSLPSL